jgi:transglutaminase-like putative cysteine protease
LEHPILNLRIRHKTTYHYHQPVSLGPHRLMLRPRESRDLQLLSSQITLSPTADLTWTQDVFGNAVAIAYFQAMTDILVIESLMTLDLANPMAPVFEIAPSASHYPFQYAPDEWTDLGALAMPQYIDPEGRLEKWARDLIAGNPTNTLALLKDLSESVSTKVSYQSRAEEGVQSPIETLDRGWGSCRDFAVLFIEAVRSLGFGARIVSGYLYNPDQQYIGSADGGSSHAWAEVYVPGAGWITFDPTNRSIGGINLIPVAASRDIRQIMPVSGNFLGMTDAFQGLTVEVSVTSR